MTALDQLCLVGIGHRSAPEPVRIAASMDAPRCQQTLDRLKAAGATAGIVLSTCNRTEIMTMGLAEEVAMSLLPEVCRSHAFWKGGREAAQHVFRVASGLDSAVLGETEIVSQWKHARDLAHANGMIQGELDLLFRWSLMAAKRVRTETDLSRGVTSYATLAVREASALLGGYRGHRVAILGAGELARRVLLELRRTPPESITIVNRCPVRAQGLATSFRAVWAPLVDLEPVLKQADVLFAAIPGGMDLPDPGNLQVSVDLGMPPALDEWRQSTLSLAEVRLQDLIDRCELNAARRRLAQGAAEAIVRHETDRLESEWVRRLERAR